MPRQTSKVLAFGQVPQANRLVGCPECEYAAVWRKGDAALEIGVCAYPSEMLPGDHLAKAQLPGCGIHGARKDPAAGREGRRPHFILRLAEAGGFPSFQRAPDAQSSS